MLWGIHQKRLHGYSFKPIQKLYYLAGNHNGKWLGLIVLRQEPHSKYGASIQLDLSSYKDFQETF